jgi:hypothetical protein
MDARLIFRDYRNSIKTEGGTQTVSPFAQWFQKWVKGDPDRQIRRVVCQEKPLRRVRYPYHKPTQVDEMNILRRSGDGMFRN